MARHRDYQARLAGHPVGEAFERAAAFLLLACGGSLIIASRLSGRRGG